MQNILRGEVLELTEGAPGICAGSQCSMSSLPLNINHDFGYKNKHASLLFLHSFFFNLNLFILIRG